MKERTKTTLAVALMVIGLLLLGFMAAQPAEGKQDVCPEEGKVESVVDGDLDNIVLDAGTLVCIKGSTTMVVVTADGESTLRELLGIDQNVSHYTEESWNTTTTTTPSTSTTVPSSTTTIPEETTTTLGSETTTTSGGSTTSTPPTTLPSYECQPGQTAEENPWCCEGFDGPDTPVECGGEEPPELNCAEDDPCWDCETMGNRVCSLPFTGVDVSLLVVAASALVTGGAVALIRSRKEN